MSDKKILAGILYFLWICSVFIFPEACKFFATMIGAWNIGVFCADLYLQETTK